MWPNPLSGPMTTKVWHPKAQTHQGHWGRIHYLTLVLPHLLYPKFLPFTINTITTFSNLETIDEPSWYDATNTDNEEEEEMPTKKRKEDVKVTYLYCVYCGKEWPSSRSRLRHEIKCEHKWLIKNTCGFKHVFWFVLKYMTQLKRGKHNCFIKFITTPVSLKNTCSVNPTYIHCQGWI